RALNPRSERRRGSARPLAEQPRTLHVAGPSRRREAPEERRVLGDRPRQGRMEVLALRLAQWFGGEAAPVARAPDALVIGEALPPQRNRRPGHPAPDAHLSLHA